MVSVVYTDVARISELTEDPYSCSFWKNEDESWRLVGDPKKCFRFLVMPDETLVVALMGVHIELYLVHQTRDLPLDKAKARFSEIAKTLYDGSDKSALIIGAGIAGLDGTVASWESEGFGVTTPDHLRAVVEQQILQLLASGDLPTPGKG